MSDEVRIAIEAAQKAGVLLSERFAAKNHTLTIKEDESLATETDFESSKIISERILSAFPDHTILSEENPGAYTQEIGSEPTWVIDPLDGTSNFIAGIPLFAIAIALVIDREPVIGLIYDALHKDLFVAEVGQGAFLNQEPMHVSERQETKGAMLFAGRGYKHRDHERHGKIIYALERETTYFRRLGTAAMMLASVASGRADSVILTGSKPWDLIGGALLVREAGGRVTDYCGNDWKLGSEDLVATNGAIHDQLITITKEQDSIVC
jgi:myo-inositol-1(or 4)-monophosphatase